MSKPRNFVGKGSYGWVVAKNGRAVKKFSERRCLVHEYLAAQYLEDCPWTVSTQGCNFKAKKLYLDLYDGSMSVWGYRERNYNQKMNALYRILRALIWLNDCGLMHADVKPSNILVNWKPNGDITELVLGDLGFLGPEIETYKSCYTAETFREKEVVSDFRHDIYSLGMICLQMFSGHRYISPQSDHYDPNDPKLKSLAELKSICKSQCSPALWKLIKKSISSNRNIRPTARKMLSVIFEVSPSYVLTSNISVDSSVDPGSEFKTMYHQLARDYGIPAITKAYNCLCSYIQENPNSPNLNLIARVILYVVSSIYGKAEYNTRSIIENTQCRHAQIYQVIRDLAQSQKFLHCLFFSSEAMLD